MSFSDFFQGYIDCLLWSTNDESTPSGGKPMDDTYTIADFAPSSLEALRKECETFYVMHAPLFEEHTDSQAGHDFWLTRNGHGCGFWDGDWPEHGDELTEASKECGEVYPYVGDDGKIYV